ncbi:MAG TPA: hypothetical protein VGE76_18500 [Opitutaceae bacterium]
MLRRSFTLLGIVLALVVSAQAQNSYVEAGAPAPDRAWSGTDYQAFAKLLTSGAVKLPTLDDPDGREIFTRLTNPENLEIYRSQHLSALLRLQGLSQAMLGCKDIVLAYAEAANKGRKVSRESAASMAILVRVTSLSFAPADEVVASVPADAPNRAQGEAGVAQMKKGFVEMLAGAEISLGERNFYSEADLAVLVAALAESVPSFVSNLSTNQRVELRNKFRKRKTEFKGKTTLAHFDTLIAALSAPQPAK